MFILLIYQLLIIIISSEAQFNLNQLGLGNLGGALNGLLGGGQRPQHAQHNPPNQQHNANNNPNIGGQVEGLLNQFGLGNQLTHQIGGLINGISANFVNYLELF
ncbi:unnamed protein product [Meloidogyne enterolobii]|uniref:Uncharacterized protein n=1 Tax=Meloidogyne enterolobii TaxID=390850 RepID=A0ACB1ATR2_MELEN